MVDRCRHKGFTYVMVLIAVAITALMAAGAAQVWSTTHQHQQLQQLRWIGNQYRQAIGSYYESSPGTLKRYPMALSDLVLDLRYLTVRRHLRRLYLDPLTDRGDWELLRGSDGGIVGARIFR